MRVFLILEALSKEEMSPAQLAKKINMNKSTLHRFLETLKSLGYVKMDQNKDLYLTQLFVDLSSKNQNYLKFRNITKPYLKKLSNNLMESAFLAVFEDDEVKYIENVESSHAVRTVFNSSKKTPAFAVASGKLFLSFLSNSKLREYLKKHELIKYTKNTKADYESLQSELEEIRGSGYAVDNEEYEIGLRGFAAPIIDNTGNIIAALCIAGIASRITNDEKIKKIINDLLAASKEISYQLDSEKGNN